MVKTMEKHTDLSPPKGTLGIPDDFMIGQAAGEGDCFFHSVAQGMNQLSISGGPFDVKSLRLACFDYVKDNKDSIYDSRSGKTWQQVILEDAVAGGYASNSSEFEIYLAHIQLTASERAIFNIGAAVWGRPDIEGCMLCQKYGITIHLIEEHHADSREVIGHQLVDGSGSRSIDENASIYNDPQMIHILNEGQCHFFPILRKKSGPSKTVEKEAQLSSLEGVQSQVNPTDGLELHPVKSVAANLQQLSQLSAQPEHLEHGTEKTESSSEAKTQQVICGWYLKECSLNDDDTWRAVAAKKKDADFKILRIIDSPTVSAALDFMRQADFYETFNQASHWFFVVICVDDYSESPSDALECLAEILDERRPVIIQWDIMHSAEHLVFFKQPGQHAFTPLQMNSASLFSTEDDLTLQLSNKGSFQLPLLLNALKLGIGSQFKGDALDLLKVSFDVKWEIYGRRLIDYAARDDDSLSLRFLLLVDWDLAHQNGDGGRTLEIAAEYGGPQSLSALLNLPITSSTEELFLSSKEKELLALMNYSSYDPWLIAAEKGRPEMLQFLIQCGADIHYQRPGRGKVTAIALAWGKERYENVQVLLEADSPFPEHFDLNGLGESKNTTALMKEVEDRRSFHQAIKKGLQNDVKKFIKSHPRLKKAYDPMNQSALMTALEAGQYEIYSLLQSEGFSAGKNEELSVVTERLTSEQRFRLKEANVKYFGKEYGSHILYLLSKSRLGFGQENRKDFGFILELYKQLDAIPEISTILKVVEHSDMTEIVFDFNRDSIVDLDPTQSSNTRGACDYRAGRIYVGAKEQSELLGTLAHELTHLAMQVCYDNECNPYEESDKQKKSEFEKIVLHYRDMKGVDSILERVFSVYGESAWPSELIVRVPHLLAHYSGEQGKQLLTQQAPGLFNFYKQQTQEDVRSFIENPARIKARHQIQHLNKLLGKMDEIEHSKIWLNDKCLLNDDVINCKGIQILSSHFPQLTILNLYQVLRRKQLNVLDIKGGYIFVSADQLENQERAETIYQAFQSATHPTLIIHCSFGYEKSATDLLSTPNSFRGKRRIIFIAVPDVAESLECKLKEHEAQILHDREYGWCDLTPASQNVLLKSTVCFQGCNMSLSELISADLPVTKFLPLPDLLAGKTLEIGKHVLTSTDDGYFEKYYIDRTFNRQVAIKQDIKKKQFPDIVATNERKFKKCCEDNPERNVHWLHKDKSGKLIWQQSQGSLSALHEYIDTQNPQVYPPENLDKFLQQAQSQKVMLIADRAGMGKTTVLTHLVKEIKQKYPTYWVVKIDLKYNTGVLEDQAKERIQANEFLSEKLLKLDSPFEKQLFKHCLQGLEEKMKVVLMFDGFDEISPNYKEVVLDLLQTVNPKRQPWLQQVWVTTRPQLRGVLEDHLQQLCYTLEPFSKDDQVGFLTTFWCQALKLQEGNQQRLKIYATSLIEKLAQSIGDKEFTGIPLQTRLLAEAFEKEVQTSYLSPKSELELRERLCLVDLYQKFIKNKLNIFLGKGEIAKEQHSDSEIDDISITKNHQKSAFEILFPEQEDSVLNIKESKSLSHEEIARIGIVHYVDNKPHFIHHTFAEYYVADFLVAQLTKDNNSWSEAQHLLLSKILLEKHYQMTRFFLDEFLENSEPSEVNIRQNGKQICNIWKVEQHQLTNVKLTTVLHQAAKEDSAHIIGFLFNSLKAAENSDTINNLLLHKGGDREKTAWHLAAGSGHMKTLQKLWGWAREVQLNMKDDLLLAKDKYGQTAWHIAARCGNKQILETLWCWAGEVQLNLKYDLLLAKDKDSQTAWHIAAEGGNKKVLETLWGWAREVQLNLKDDLLLAKDYDERSAWNLAAKEGNKEILETLWGWAGEVQLNVKDDLLLAKDYGGRSAWNLAAKESNKEILETLWVWAREVKLNLKDDLLLAKDGYGQTAWHIAARCGKKEILEALWGWAREVQLNLKDDLLLAKDCNGQSAWHIAAWCGNKEILETLWGWAREVQLNLKDDLLLAKDNGGKTAWHIAAWCGKKEILEALWGCAREVQLNLKDDVLLAKDEDGETAWHKAAQCGKKEILEALWGCAREVQLNLKDDLLLAKDKDGQTAWHKAARCGKKEILEALWGCAREVQLNLKDDLLLAKDKDGETAWIIAARHCKKEILETLWGWAREVELNLKDDLLLAKDKGGQTVWNIAAQNGNKEVLETLWCWAREVRLNPKDDLLLAKDKDGQTAWSIAAWHCKKEILETLWGWGREVQLNLKDDLLLAKDKGGQTVWIIAAQNGNKEVLETLWCWAREVRLNPKDDLLLAKDKDGQTAWSIAAWRCKKEILETLWGWGREVQLNLKDDLLLAKDRYGQTAWPNAARLGEKEILETLWCWGREVQLNLKDDLLLAKNRYGETAWHIASQWGKREILETLWGWAREVQVNLKDDLLLAKDKYGQTAWHLGARDGNQEILETLFRCGREVEINLRDDLLLAKNKDGETAWDKAARDGNTEVLERLWGWGREVQLNLRDDLLLAKNKYGQTAWHIAVIEGNNENLETLWGWGREVQLNLRDELLLAKDTYGQTALNLAASHGKKEILETLWGWGREVQLNLEDDLLLAKHKNGETAWDKAALDGNKEVLETLWGWGRQVQLNLKDDLLLAKDKDGQTAWNVAARCGYKEILETLWGWAREVQLNLKDDLLLAKDKDGETAWNVAARRGYKEILETLWGWAIEVQLNLKDDLLLAKDKDGETAWHLAAWRGDKEILETLWGWAREVQLNLKDDLLLAKDKDGQTAWNVATFYAGIALQIGRCLKEILETLWAWGREVQLNLKNDLLLSKNKRGETAWQEAVYYGNKEILEIVWGWGKEVKLDLKGDLLLAKDEDGRTAWHIAARRGNKEILETLWGWAREVQLNLKNDVLLAKDDYGETAWHIAVWHHNKEILETVSGWARELELNEDGL